MSYCCLVRRVIQLNDNIWFRIRERGVLRPEERNRASHLHYAGDVEAVILLYLQELLSLNIIGHVAPITDAAL
eukprot:scaffold7267_cov395-Prasinococcus_capsulatus_cf.AAC.2